jgi:hypothetical protein
VSARKSIPWRMRSVQPEVGGCGVVTHAHVGTSRVVSPEAPGENRRFIRVQVRG